MEGITCARSFSDLTSFLLQNGPVSVYSVLQNYAVLAESPGHEAPARRAGQASKPQIWEQVEAGLFPSDLGSPQQ